MDKLFTITLLFSGVAVWWYLDHRPKYKIGDVLAKNADPNFEVTIIGTHDWKKQYTLINGRYPLVSGDPWTASYNDIEKEMYKIDHVDLPDVIIIPA